MFVSCSPEADERIKTLIDKLESVGAEQAPQPLQNPAIFGNYEVAFSAAGARQVGQPAGGRFRGALGRSLFQTTGLFQHVLSPNCVASSPAPPPAAGAPPSRARRRAACAARR